MKAKVAGWLMGRGGKAMAPVFVFGLALVGSVACGSPARLPGAALGWTPLLHVERASAALAVMGTVWLVGWHALHGRFPIKFGNIEYANETRASAATVDGHEQRLELIEDYLALADRRRAP
jgi:hypothetical protein